MVREMKVYGGRVEYLGENRRAVVATRTKKRAIELIGCSRGEFDGYWTETHNAEEISDALFFPEEVIVTD